MSLPRLVLVALLATACRSAPPVQAPVRAKATPPAPPSVAERTPPRPAGPLTPAQIAERAMPSIVLIRTPYALGTGFIVDADGRIATNLHVIEGADRATIVLHDGREIDEVVVLDVDEDHDLAVLGIDAEGLTPLELGDSGAVHAGDRVVAIGHPLGLGDTVSDGLVSAIRVIDSSVTLLQISAPIAPGSSGGPLFNDRGQVIGIATLFGAKGQNLNFGMPVAYLRPLLTADEGHPLAELARAWAATHPSAGPKRDVPRHELRLLDDCSSSDVDRAARTILDAIDVGAPLYNDGNHEACYRVYEGAALELTRRLPRCAGVKKALEAGIDRAGTLSTYNEKAWAMRDAFDGLLDVIGRAKKRR